MEWKDLFAKFKAREDYFEAEAGPEAVPEKPAPPPRVDPIASVEAENTDDEDIVTVGNTQYRRVRLKIVDVWDEETTDQIASLKKELERARKENDVLREANERMRVQHDLMQQLNVNLHTLRLVDIDKSTDRIIQLEAKAVARQERVRELEEQIREARVLIHEARLAIELLEEENQKFRSEQSAHKHTNDTLDESGELQWRW